jgi:lysophospholipase L1-like esterase
MNNPFKNKWFLLFLSTLMTYLVLEVFLRRLQPEDIRSWNEKYVSYNSLGSRDYEHQIKKEKGVFRILILGDSMIFGTWINKLEDTITAKLEKKLNQNLDSTRFEVMNLAVGGHNTGDQIYKLTRFGMKYQPDLVILGFFHNDLPHIEDNFNKHYLAWGPEWFSKLNGLFGYIEKRSMLFKFVRHRVVNGVIKAGLKNSYPDYLSFNYTTRAWDISKIYLDILYKISQAKRFHLLIGNIPFINSLSDNSYSLIEANNKFNKYCAERKISCIDFYEEGFKSKKTSDLIARPGDFHFNEVGTELVASAVARFLAPLKEYKNINKFHNAFTLNELINSKNLVNRLDKKFELLETADAHLVLEDLKNNGTSLEVNRIKTDYVFSLTTKKNNEENYLTKDTRLDKNGRFLSYENKRFVGREQHLIESNGLKVDNARSVWTRKLFKNSNGNRELTKTYQSIEYFKLKIENNIRNLYVAENVIFADPIVLEKRIFKKSVKKTINFNLRDHYIAIIKKFGRYNSKLIKGFLGDGFKDNSQFYGKLSIEELKEVSEGLIVFEGFMFFKMFGFETYLEKLHASIIKNVKKKYILKSLEQFYTLTGSEDKLRNFYNLTKKANS